MKQLLFFCFMVSFGLQAQLTNVGELTVAPDTELSIVEEFSNTDSGSLVNDGDIYAYAGWANRGSVDFLSSTGITRFMGNATQLISGAAPNYFYDVLFSNNSSTVPFQLSATLNVQHQLYFDQGIIDNRSFGGALFLGPQALYSDVSNDAHVNGGVHKLGETSFEFPIGDGGFYRKAIISAPQSQQDGFAAAYFLEQPDPMYAVDQKEAHIDQINTAEYWTITRATGNAAVVLSLSWDPNTTPPQLQQAATEERLHIVRWDPAAQQWQDLGGLVNLQEQTVSTLAPIAAFGVFTLATVVADTELPGAIEIYNIINLVEDGVHDFFWIRNINNFPNNTLKIFNRWGTMVFETSGYNESNNVFTGISDNNLTIQKQEKLPTGTYFYLLDYTVDEGGSTRNIQKSGYLYVISN